MSKYRKKPIVIEAEQWFLGLSIEGVEIKETELIYSGNEEYFYLSNVANQNSPFNYPDAWLPVKEDGKILPFSFYKVKSGRRVVAREADQKLVQRYLDYAGAKKLPEPQVFIETLEGRHEVTEGDWIITGVNGEKYPCKPDIFEKTYEKAE